MVFLALFIPFLLPFYIDKEKVSESRALYLFFPNAFVWVPIYFFLLHVILLALGSTDADVPKWLVPLSNNPSDFFGTFFFLFFFPLMAFYLYITQTEQWDTREIRRHFAEHIPTKKEIRHAIVEKYEKRKKRKRLFDFFWKRFLWSFIPLLGLFIYANLGAEGTTPWIEIIILSLFCAVSLALIFTMRAEEKYGKQQKALVEEKQIGKKQGKGDV